MGKITKISMSLLFVAVAAVCALNSCNSNGCMDNQSSLPLAGFYSSQTKAQIAVDSLTIYGVGAADDSILYNNEKLQQAYLPLRINAGLTQYVIHYEQKALSSESLNDTLTMKYKSTPYFVSTECGVVYIFDLEEYDYTKHLIDSINIPTMKFTNADDETIKVFFRTGE